MQLTYRGQAYTTTPTAAVVCPNSASQSASVLLKYRGILYNRTA
jgi:hypothetical protein